MTKKIMMNITHRCAERMHELSGGLLSAPVKIDSGRLLIECSVENAFEMVAKSGKRFWLIRKKNTNLELWTGCYNTTEFISKTTRGFDAPQHLEYDAKAFLDDTGVMNEKGASE